MEDAEFSLEAARRPLVSAKLNDARVHAQFDGCDIGNLQRVFGPQADAAVDRGMNHNTARKGQVGVQRGLETRAESVSDRAKILLRAQCVRPAALRLEHLFRAREVALREQCGEQAVLRGAAWI